jgi:hypothetical protein
MACVPGPEFGIAETDNLTKPQIYGFADDKAIEFDLINMRSAMNGVDILLGTHTYMQLIRLTLDLLVS